MIPSSTDLRAIIRPWAQDTIASSINEAAKVGHVTPDDILGPGRKQTVARSRQGAMWLAYKRGVSKSAIADYFKRDWSTVHSAIDAAQRRHDAWGEQSTTQRSAEQ